MLIFKIDDDCKMIEIVDDNEVIFANNEYADQMGEFLKDLKMPPAIPEKRYIGITFRISMNPNAVAFIIASIINEAKQFGYWGVDIVSFEGGNMSNRINFNF